MAKDDMSRRSLTPSGQPVGSKGTKAPPMHGRAPVMVQPAQSNGRPGVPQWSQPSTASRPPAQQLPPPRATAAERDIAPEGDGRWEGGRWVPGAPVDPTRRGAVLTNRPGGPQDARRARPTREQQIAGTEATAGLEAMGIRGGGGRGRPGMGLRAPAQGQGDHSQEDAQRYGRWGAPNPPAPTSRYRETLQQTKLRQERLAGSFEPSVEALDDKYQRELNKTSEGLTYSEGAEINEIDQEAFAKLSPREQAAIKFNTALVNAAAADKGLSADLATDAQRDAYDNAMRKLFGDDAVGGTYAPNTAALLQELQLGDLRGSIDDYLQLNSAVYDTDLERLEQGGTWSDTVMWKDRPLRQQNAAEIAFRVDALQDRITGLLDRFDLPTDNIGDIMRFDQQIDMLLRNASQSFGAPLIDKSAVDDAPAQSLGWGESQADLDFQSAFERIIRKDQKGQWTYDELVNILNNSGYDPADFFQYAGERLEKNKTEGGSLGEDKTVAYLSNKEVWKALGLKEEK